MTNETQYPQLSQDNPQSTGHKPRPNHKIYLQTLRQMTPAQRLLKAFELSDFSKQLFIHGLRRRFPDLPPDEFAQLLSQRLEKCHNRNY
ncbi:MAG: hypothetical protein H6631_07080 [Anaerolineaceae bacterium]|nr:hypothetical protein [Anaerolineaceae bacterium]